MGGHRSLTRGVDDLGDVAKPGIVAFVGRAEAPQLVPMSSAACAFAGPRQAWEDEVMAGVREGVQVQPSGCTEGGREES